MCCYKLIYSVELSYFYGLFVALVENEMILHVDLGEFSLEFDELFFLFAATTDDD